MLRQQSTPAGSIWHASCVQVTIRCLFSLMRRGFPGPSRPSAARKHRAHLLLPCHGVCWARCESKHSPISFIHTRTQLGSHPQRLGFLYSILHLYDFVSGHPERFAMEILSNNRKQQGFGDPERCITRKIAPDVSYMLRHHVGFLQVKRLASVSSQAITP